MKTGLINIAFGIFIALVGVVVTGLTYSMVSQKGGTYVVATGAFVVGAWRILLGLFQIIRGAVGGSDAPATVPPPTPRVPPRAETAERANPVRMDAPVYSNISQPYAEPKTNGVPIIGGLLIAGAALRFFGLIPLAFRVPSSVLSNLQFVLTSLVLPTALAVAALVAGVLCLRNRSSGIAFGIAVCGVGLLFEAYVLTRLLGVPARYLTWMAWAYLAVHTIIYVAGLVVLLRASARQNRAFAGGTYP